MKATLFKAVSVAALLATGLGAPALAGKSDDTLVWATDRELNIPFVWWDSTSEMAAMMHHIFDTLVYRNPETMKYEPLLATSWEWVDDATLELKLREGVTFHDGSAFDADDVVATYTALLSPEAKVINASLINWMDKVEKVDDHTVRILMGKPFPPALEFLSGTRMGILPAEVVEGVEKGADGNPNYAAMKPIGTGPYKMAEFAPGEGMTLTRNEDYFDGPKGHPEIGTLKFRTITDQDTRVAELMTGGVDWITDLPNDTVEQMRGLPDIEITDGPDMRIAYLALDVNGRSGDTPLKDVRVRKAIAHAIDRKAISENLVGPASEVIDAACYPTQVGCTQDVPTYAYDPEKAKSLLAEAGYGEGIDITFDAYRERQFVEAAIGYLNAVGINAKLNYLQWSGLRERLDSGKVEMSQRTWASSGLNDVSAIASVLLKGSPDDYCNDAEIIDLLNKGDSTIDEEKRAGYYKDALVKVQEEVCWIPLYSYSKAYAHTDDLDFFPTADGFPLFYMASWKE